MLNKLNDCQREEMQDLSMKGMHSRWRQDSPIDVREQTLGRMGVLTRGGALFPGSLSGLSLGPSLGGRLSEGPLSFAWPMGQHMTGGALSFAMLMLSAAMLHGKRVRQHRWPQGAAVMAWPLGAGDR